MTTFNIEKAFQKRIERGYKNLYFLVDLHSTIIKKDYSLKHEERTLYPGAAEVLRYLSDREDMKLILWTSSTADYVYGIRKWLSQDYCINFDFCNENPHFKVDALADFSKKFAFDILLDDRASFSAETDWFLVAKSLEIQTGHKILEWNSENLLKLNNAIFKTQENLNNLTAFT